MVESNEKINICLSCDDNYAKYAGVVITSVLTNALPEDNKRNIEWSSCKPSEYKREGVML